MTVVVASGHLTDEPGREKPRFPERSVPRVVKEIRRQLDDWKIGPGDLLVCGGARGGDLLAAAEARRLGAGVRLCLALPREKFVAASVDLPGTDWLSRFDDLVATSDVRVQDPPAHGGNVFEAANEWMIAQARPAGTGTSRGLLVWDGETTGARGGTGDFAALAAGAGIGLYGIDPTPRLSADRQWAAGPKRMLALDGGGIRGVLSLGVLGQIEAGLRAWTGRNDLVLADYFDYIGGTSTGAIIAAALSLGHTVEDVLARYRALAASVFRFNWRTPLVSLHPTGPLRTELDALLGEGRRLGDPDLRTLLLVVLHNVDPHSPSALSNCPSARYNRPERRLGIHPERGGPHQPDRNLDLSLSALVRGSAAAPLYFAPQHIRIGSRTVRFEDGGMSPYNNPAFLLYAMATQPEYQVRWPSGADKLLVVSVGTGLGAARSGWARSSVQRLTHLPGVLINQGSIGQDYLCRTLARTTFGPPIDNEVGSVPTGQGLFTYARYNVDVADLDQLRAALAGAGVEARDIRPLAAIGRVDPRKLTRLNSTRHVDDLLALGRLAGRLVDVERHFAGFGPD